jgi:hypothetical protein
MGNTLETLEIERDVLREQVRGKEVSSWKIWQYKMDNELMRKQERICEINNILMGARIQRDSPKP